MDRAAGDVVSLTIHGPLGVLDLHVPAGASSIDVATAYSREANLPVLPVLYTPLGTQLDPQAALQDSGVVSGAVLVAVPPGVRSTPPRRTAAVMTPSRLAPSALSALWCTVAVVLALVAGWFASRLPDASHLRTATLVVLGVAALLGVQPVGRLAAHRALAAPAFAGAVAFALAWDPAPERLPTVLGVAALTAAVTAAVGRALDQQAEEGLRVWMVGGVLVFLLAMLAALVGLEPYVVWAVLLAVAMLAARLVPVVAIDVPDQYLLDLERLAVTAWSARDRPRGRRGRIVVPRQAVVAVADAGRRTLTAACAAVLVVSAVSSFLLLRDTPFAIDELGARILVGLVGVSLLLSARSYRHALAGALLRVAGLVCLVELTVVLLRLLDGDALVWLAVAAVVLGLLLVLVAVAVGRGWRSAWWSRQAEVLEALTGSCALATLVVAVGVFRHLWELTG